MKDRKNLLPTFDPIPHDNLELPKTIEDQLRPILDAEQSLNDILDTAEEAKLYLLDTVEAIMSHVSPDEREFLGSVIYWIVGSLGPKEFKTLCQLAPKQVMGVPCDVCCYECKKPLIAKSHTHLKELRGRWRIYCGECEEVRREKEERAAALKAEVWEGSRAKQLQTMPYDEYLQTDEWNKRRQRHLEDADHACQLCNASDVKLHVHHRTYERRGDERHNDLIVLCADCHATFHGKDGGE